jgi:hypothetical protein
MRKNKVIIFILLIFVISLNGCATAGQVSRDDYGILCSAASTCSYAMIGEYGDSMPNDLTIEKLLSVCEKNIPPNFFAELRRYHLEVKPKGTYYLLLVYDPHDKALILFDYSCTAECDGRVMLEPNKYDIHSLESYDPCKNGTR